MSDRAIKILFMLTAVAMMFGVVLFAATRNYIDVDEDSAKQNMKYPLEFDQLFADAEHKVCKEKIRLSNGEHQLTYVDFRTL